MSTPPRPTVLVLGDVMLDRYLHGTVRRISPEAPVLVLDSEHEEARLGGAGAVATLLAGLGIAPVVAGIVGDDLCGGVLLELFGGLHSSPHAPREGNHSSPHAPREGSHHAERDGYDTQANGAIREGTQLIPAASRPIIVAPSRGTTVKRRFISQSSGRCAQQLLRVDRESRQPLSRELEDKLLAAALAGLDDAEAVLISDYGKGVCTTNIVQSIIAAARKRCLPVLVDPRRGADYALYRGAAVIKPNRHEAGDALGREIRSRANGFAAGRELCQRWGFQAAAVTLDSDGLALVTTDGVEEHFAAHQRPALDVTGAGDTVLAVLGAALVRGMTLHDACRLAVQAAGLQVERFGVSPVAWSELSEDGLPNPSRATSGQSALGSASHAAPGNAEDGLPNAARKERDGLGGPSRLQPVSLETLLVEVALHRAHGRRVIFTNGCFDLFHAGHLHCLTSAKALGDVLVVAINSDSSVRRLKGESRPIICQSDRALLVAALECVDYVMLFDDDTPERLIALLRPDVLVKGAEVYANGIPGESIVRSYGGRVELVPLLPGTSTTAIAEQVQSPKSKVQSPKSKAQSPKP